MNNVMIFLQARMGSSRLPGKTLKQIKGRPLIAYCLERIGLIEGITKAKVTIVTSVNKTDDPLAQWCIENNVNVFRGSELNVLERYFQASEKLKPSHIVRATGDNPFVDPYLASILIKYHVDGNYDYSSTKSEVGSFLPDGIGLEMFSYKCLETVYHNSTDPNHFEHVNDYILENPDKFRIGVPPMKEIESDLSKVRLTVDTSADFEKAEKIISAESYDVKIKLFDLLKLV